MGGYFLFVWESFIVSGNGKEIKVVRLKVGLVEVIKVLVRR